MSTGTRDRRVPKQVIRPSVPVPHVAVSSDETTEPVWETGWASHEKYSGFRLLSIFLETASWGGFDSSFTHMILGCAVKSFPDNHLYPTVRTC